MWTGLKAYSQCNTQAFQKAEIGNNGNIGITGFAMWKQKIKQQNFTKVSIEPRTSAI